MIHTRGVSNRAEILFTSDCHSLSESERSSEHDSFSDDYRVRVTFKQLQQNSDRNSQFDLSDLVGKLDQTDCEIKNSSEDSVSAIKRKSGFIEESSFSCQVNSNTLQDQQVMSRRIEEAGSPEVVPVQGLMPTHKLVKLN